jgi:hypothetical protein
MQDKDAPRADEPVRADPGDDLDAAAPGTSDQGGEDDADGGTFDVQVGGQVHTLPAALKGAFLRQADYTRKTQELAQHRRALIAERQAVAQQAQSMGQAQAGGVELAALDHQLADLRAVDWQGFAAHDPRGAQALWGRFQALAQARDGLAQTLAHHRSRAQIQAAREAAARMAATGQALQKEIAGWSPELAAKLVDYARGHGVTLDELGAADDPRVWKILHCAYQGDSAKRQDGAAASAARVQAVRPAITVSGAAAGGGGVRDELATKEWMKRRNEQMRKGR